MDIRDGSFGKTRGKSWLVFFRVHSNRISCRRYCSIFSRVGLVHDRHCHFDFQVYPTITIGSYCANTPKPFCMITLRGFFTNLIIYVARCRHNTIQVAASFFLLRYYIQTCLSLSVPFFTHDRSLYSNISILRQLFLKKYKWNVLPIYVTSCRYT